MATVKKVKKAVKKPVKTTAKKIVKKQAVKATPEEALGLELEEETSLSAMLQKFTDDASAKMDDLKKRFDQVDAGTKKKIVTGLSVVAAGLVVLAGASKVKSNQRKKAAKK